MPSYADQTAYYFNGKLPRLALIAKGVRFPEGQWVQVADELLTPWAVQDLLPELFPGLHGKPVSFVALLTDFDVQGFERELEEEPTGSAG